MIRTFRPADIFRVQRLLQRAVRMHTVQSLLTPRSPLWLALVSVNPLDDAKCATYVLEQRIDDLVRGGLLQVQKRAGRPEADIHLFAPHPDEGGDVAHLWQLLLARYTEDAIQANIARLYATVADDPQILHTLASVGFRPYLRQTIWQLKSIAVHEAVAEEQKGSETILRPQQPEDEWGLLRLYGSSVPRAVQLAEGAHSDRTVRPLILDWFSAENLHRSVLLEKGKIRGSVQIALGRRGAWLQLWLDTHHPNGQQIEQLVNHGLSLLRTQLRTQGKLGPVYVGVDEYQGGVASVLVDLGFTPYTDVVKTVRHVIQRIIKQQPVRVPILEPVASMAPVPYQVKE